MTTSPSINNSWSRVALRRIRSFPPAERKAVLDAIPEDTRGTIAGAKRSDYLPATHAVAVCEGLISVIGTDRAVDFWETVVGDSYAGGLLEPLITKMRRDELDFGLIGLASDAWALSTRDCGKVGLAPSRDGKVRLEAQGLPDYVRDSAGIQAMFAGTLRAMLAFSKLRASVEVSTDNADGSIAFELKLRAPN